ncbi:MAG: radical SAM protein [Candidatus Omnitrophota bacterium]
MKILLISVAGCPRTPSDFIPDNGLALLASLFISQGHQVKILDYNTTETLKRSFPENISTRLKKIAGPIFQGSKPGLLTLLRLSFLEKKLRAHQIRVFYEIGSEIADLTEREKVDFVGLKLWNGDGFTASLIIADVLKKRNPKILVFGGGPQVDFFRENIYRATSDFDALVYGEGEHAILGLVDFVQGKKGLREIPNLIFRDSGRIVTTPQKWTEDLNQLPFANYDPSVYPAMKDNGRLKFIVLDESRGCSFSCYFCIHPVKSGRPRVKSVERIIAEITHYQEKYGVSLFRYGGSNTPPKLLEEVARSIIQNNLKIKYTVLTDLRQEGIDFSLLKDSGCFAVFFGVESTDPGILAKAINKKAFPERMENILKEAKTAGIFIVVSLIVPAPGETEETKKKTLEFLLRTRPDSVLVQFPGILPGTEWFKNPEKYGFSIKNKKAYPDKVMNYKMRLFFPPRFWDPLPYRVDGKKFRSFVRETELFLKKLESVGLTTGIADDIALMSKYSHLSPKEFRDLNRGYFFTGDALNLQELIVKINGGKNY